MSHQSFMKLAEIGYQAYYKQASGKMFDGKPLPSFEALGAERQMCWVAAAHGPYLKAMLADAKEQA